MKNSKIKRFNFPNECDNEIFLRKKIIQISSSSDGSFICGSTTSFLFKINYETLQKIKNKATIEKKYNYTNITLLEMHPSYDKNTYLICSKEKDIFIIDFKNEDELIAKYTNELFSKINFIQWQNKNNIISSNNIIYIYENDILLSKIIDEEIPFSMKFLCITNSKLEESQILITGYNGIIKFWDFTNEIPKSSFCSKNVLKDNIDIIEGNNNGSFILIGSKQSRILQNYEFTRVKIFFVFEFEIPNEGGKIINVSFIKKEGIVVSCETCFYLYFINNREIFFEQCIILDKKIDNFKVYSNHINTKDFFIYTSGLKLFAKEFTFDNHDLHLSSCYNILLKNNQIKDIQNFYYAMKNKEDIIIDKINQKCFDIQIKDIIFQLQFFEKKPFPTISIKKNEKYELNEILKQTIEIFDRNKSLNKSLMKFIDDLINLIKSNSLPKNIVPYVKTCTFTWTLDGRIILFKNNQIDFKQLKQNDKEITSSNHLKNFVKFCIDKNPSIKQIQNNDKLIEEDDEETKYITSLPLSKVINWEFSFEKDINEILNYLNHSQSLPSIFVNKTKSKNEIENKNYLVNYEPPQRMNQGIFNELNNKQKKIFYDINNCEFKMNILNKFEIHIFSKETLYNIISSIKDKSNYSDISVLMCLLKQINYNINLILYEKNYVLINLYRQDLLNLLINLEKKKNYEYLFICIVVIIKRIYSDNIDSHLNNSLDDKKSNNGDDNISRNSKENFKKVKSNSLINDPSFSNISDSPTKVNNSEMINVNNENILIGSTNNNESIELDYDSYNEYELLQSNNHENLNFERNKSQSFDLNKMEEKENKFNISLASYQFESKYKSKELNEIFNNKIKNTLLLYLYYFANELLYRKKRISEKEEIKQFLKNISYIK